VSDSVVAEAATAFGNTSLRKLLASSATTVIDRTVLRAEGPNNRVCEVRAVIKKILHIVCLLTLIVASGRLAPAQPIQYSYSGQPFVVGTEPFANAQVDGTVTLDSAATSTVLGPPPLGVGSPAIVSFSFTSDGLEINNNNWLPGSSSISLTFGAS
jgi:hypothetical protein